MTNIAIQMDLEISEIGEENLRVLYEDGVEKRFCISYFDEVDGND